jgi:hypothetical protein
MMPVHITPKPSSEIEKLAQGVNRAAGAHEALEESELTPKQVQQPEALLKNLSAPSATTSPAVAELKWVDGHQAVVGKITVNGQQLDTLLSEGSFNKSRSDQREYAAQLRYRMATREENRAYVIDLLVKEGNSTINDAEKNALLTYQERYVRDTEGGVDVDGRRVSAEGDYWGVDVDPCYGALFVRASAESK